MALDDAKALEEIEALTDAIAARMELAVVQRVPQQMIDLLRDGQENFQPLQVLTGYDQVVMRFGRRGNALEVSFEVNGGYRVASFRFQGT